jgi:hypothetical protein
MLVFERLCLVTHSRKAYCQPRKDTVRRTNGFKLDDGSLRFIRNTQTTLEKNVGPLHSKLHPSSSFSVHSYNFSANSSLLPSLTGTFSAPTGS